MRTSKPGKIVLAVPMLFVAGFIAACTDAGSGENRLVYNDARLQINEVKCLSALKQLVAEFDGGVLRLSPNDSEAGFRALLRFEDLARGSLTNRDRDRNNTGGIELDVESGASGQVEMMREAWVMDPERFPGVEPISLQVQLYCPPAD